MRFSILLILFLFPIGNKSFAFNSEYSNINTKELSTTEISRLICSKQWTQSSNENHVFIFNSLGTLEVFRMTDENKLSTTKLFFKLESENGKYIISMFNSEHSLVNSYILNSDGRKLNLKGITNDENINLIEKGCVQSTKIKKLIGDWRGRQLTKVKTLKKGKFQQEEIQFSFAKEGSYVLDSKSFNKKSSVEKGSYIILADSNSIILKPYNRFKRPYVIKLKHVTDSELVLMILDDNESKASSNVTLLR
ncbi:MAG: hypothetical protein P8P48_08530 [Saprospiraceae bacterium]|nr:hypothetical protein [Saprospiraceae bacterium]